MNIFNIFSSNTRVSPTRKLDKRVTVPNTTRSFGSINIPPGNAANTFGSGGVTDSVFDETSSLSDIADRGSFSGANSDLLDASRRYSRRLWRSSSLLKSYAVAIDKMIIADGFKLVINSDIDSKIKKDIGYLWEEFSGHCGVGIGLRDLISSALQTSERDGDSFIRLAGYGDELVVKLFEGDAVPTVVGDGAHARGRVIDGVVVDNNFLAVGFLFNPLNQDAISYRLGLGGAGDSGSRKFMSRVDLLQLMRVVPPMQFRGLPAAAGALRKIGSLDRYDKISLNSVSQLVNLFAFITKDETMAADSGLSGMTDVNPLDAGSGLAVKGDSELMQEGIRRFDSIDGLRVIGLQHGYKINTLNSLMNTKGYVEIVNSVVNVMCSSLGFSRYALMKDLGDTSFSGARQAAISDRQFINSQRICLENKIIYPIFKRWAFNVFADFGFSEVEIRRVMASVKFQWGTQEWIDPLKDAKAMDTLIKAGVISRRQAVNNLGSTLEELAADKVALEQIEAEYGINLDSALDSSGFVDNNTDGDMKDSDDNTGDDDEKE